MEKNRFKVVLVTGGSRGIGRACCLALARDGFQIALSFNKSESEALSVAAEIKEIGAKVETYQGDLFSAQIARSLVSRVVSDFGRLDVLVNNAGIGPVTGIEEITEMEWDQVLNVNLRAAFFCAQSALRQMQTQRGGRIIFISSQAGQAGGVFVGAHYVASKAALLGLTKSFARIGAASGVLVNCISPGLIDTPLTEAFPKEKVSKFTESIPLKRRGTAEEVADAVAFLASDSASYVTGATLCVNGGFLMV